MKKQECYTLLDICTWASDNNVSLPTVQRGFVWKPSQIENLWDSLLRGYPVGAFVLSLNPGQLNPPKTASFELLDGQQRATAICLGFGSHTFRQSEERFKIFIDLEPPPRGDTREYVFRVITRSHPWGYQRKDNTKILDSDSIRSAMKLYGIDDPLSESLDKFFPYDAAFPVPFEFFLGAAVHDPGGDEGLLNTIQNWEHWEKITGARAKDPLVCVDEKKRESRITELLGNVRKMLEEVKVPVLYLDYSHLVPNQRPQQQSSTNDAQANGNPDSSQELDEVENLFIRLNSGGTPLRGEDLNYSILKARIDRDLQDVIETSCEGLMVPARFITIAYRLYQQERAVKFGDAISMRIKPKQFQKTMAENSDDFKNYLEKFLSEKVTEFDGRTLMEQVKYLLAYDETNNRYGFPYLIYSKVAGEAPEVMFMLLYRLKIKKDRLNPREDEGMHRRMLGMISLFLWLGKGENRRDRSRLLSDIWPAVKVLGGPIFWSSSTIQRARLNALPSFPAELDKNLAVAPEANVDVLSKRDDFYRRMFFNRDLILYAQRDSLSLWFKDKHYRLDDTNVPFDWDHISPNKFCRKKRIPKALKMLYNSNGNFRAWPYSLNRFDQDDVPARKLNPQHADQTDEKAHERIKQLLKHCSRYRPELEDNPEGLKDTLLNWSFCEQNWCNCAVTDLRLRRKGWKTVYSLIMSRNISICEEWYRNLAISSLIPGNQEVDLGKLVDGRKWRKDPLELKNEKFFGDEYDTTTSTYWLNRIDLEPQVQVHLSFGYEKGEELAENGIVFIIIVDNVDRIVDKESLAGNDSFEIDERSIYSTFTLISNDYDSCVELFDNMREWLGKLPAKRIKDLTVAFTNSLSRKMREDLDKKRRI